MRNLNSKGKMSRFTHFVSSFGAFHKNWAGCGGLSDCEELVGVTHRRNWAKFAERIAACFFAGYLSSWN